MSCHIALGLSWVRGLRGRTDALGHDSVGDPGGRPSPGGDALHMDQQRLGERGTPLFEGRVVQGLRVLLAELRGQEMRMLIRPGDQRGAALSEHDVLAAGDARMFRTFAVLGMLKISTSGSCHANQTGTWCGRPSGRTVPSQITGSAVSRSAV